MLIWGVTVLPSKTFKIKDIGQVVGGGTPSTANPDYYGGDIPWLSPKDLSGHKKRYINRGEKNITKLGLNNSSAKLMPAGTVLLSSRAPIGYIAIAENEICTNQGFKSIIPDRGKVDSEFLYYSLKNNVEEIKDLGVGTTFAEISGKVLENYEIDLPELDNQKKIVSILSSLDRLIELNQEINANLKVILEAEYRRIKHDYSCNHTLLDLCEIVKNKRPSIDLTCNNYYSTENMLPNKAGVVPATMLPSDGKVTACERGDVLISNIRPYFKKIHYCSESSGCSADVLCFRAKIEDNSPLLFSILYSDEFFDYVVAGSKGTKMPRGDKNQIMEFPITIPPKDELQTFNKMGKNILSTVSKNTETIQQLITIRDYILPKLMSGEIDVSQLDLDD